MTGSEKLQAAFLEDRTALVPYLTGGYPSLEEAYEVGAAYVEAGADVVEIGVPFSDSLADGPVIQNTNTLALKNGANLGYCLELASHFAVRVPVVLLTSYNVVFARGAEGFLEEAAGAGVSGLVIPDLPIDEALDLREMAAEKGVSICPLAAPTTSDDRLDEISRAASGFVYCVSVAGVTGAREKLPPGAIELLRRARARVSVPVVLGFGISSPEAAVQAAAEADGIIIGSKLMQLVESGGPEGAGAWLKEVREALDGAGVKAGSRD
ncbi:MAG: tryptophan synthase subunit alpha [Actinomycetota bacterium]|nr:tryptophan synthase subunit alpha [Actinomycetota bacterium]